jgi:hypothetical protein
LAAIDKIIPKNPKVEKVFERFLEKLSKTKGWKTVDGDLRTAQGIHKDRNEGELHCPLTAVAEAEYGKDHAIEPCAAGRAAALLGVPNDLMEEIVSAADTKIKDMHYLGESSEKTVISERRRAMLKAVGLSKAKE